MPDPETQPETQPDLAATRRPRVSPYCVHLESKKLSLAESPPMVAEDVLDASQHCWCGRTKEILGPDRYLCHPEECDDSTRDCFESPLKGLL